MMQRLREGLKSNPRWLAIGACAILAAADLWFVGGYLRKQRDLSSVQTQAVALEADLAQLQDAEAQGLQSLQDSLKASQDRLAALKSAFPNTTGGFDLFRRSFELADASGVEIQSIRRTSDASQSSPAGTMREVTYSIDATGRLSQCMHLLQRLEDEGLQTVALDNITLDPVAQECSFDVHVASVSPADSQTPAPAETPAGGQP
jgi:Tfp pilus assembly protein PilO